jgi:hypothetical protein
MLWRQGSKFTTSDGSVVANTTINSVTGVQQTTLGIGQRRFIQTNQTPPAGPGSGVTLASSGNSLAFSDAFGYDFT